MATHIDLFNFQDEETNYLYSDIIDKTIEECETKEQKIRGEILDAYTATMCRFFQISSLIIPSHISDEEFENKRNNIELDSKIATSVFKTNSLNMLYSLERLDLFIDPESDYVPEFDHIARKRKKANQKDRNLTIKKFYKEVQDALIGYIEIGNYGKYCEHHGFI